jgi:hypothetical protein
MSFVTSRQAAAAALSRMGHALRRPDLNEDECVRACQIELSACHLDTATNLELKNLLLSIIGLLLLCSTCVGCSFEKLNPMRTNRLLSTVHNATAPPTDGGVK